MIDVLLFSLQVFRVTPILTMTSSLQQEQDKA